MHCALPLTDAWWLTSKDAHLSLRSRTNKKYNISKIYGYFLFSFLAQLLSVPLQSIFHIFSEKYVIFSEYLNICTGVNKTDQATICSKSPPTSTSVQLPFLSLWTQRNVELIPDEGSGLSGKKKEKRVLENNSAASWRFEGFLSTAHAALKSSPHLLTSVTFSRSDYFRLLLVVWQHAFAAFPLVHPLLTAITSPAFRPPHLPWKIKI